MLLLRKNFLLILVLILASIFRLTNLDLIEFKADEGINLFLTSRPIFGHPFPPGGTVSSIGITNFPIANYLLFPMVLISVDPKAISFLIALFNVVAIGLFFLILRKYYSETLAFIASSLLATSPWAILLSRKIWAQDLLFPMMIPLIYSFHKIVVDRDSRFFVLFIAVSLFLIQIHQSALFFILPLIIFMFLKKTGLSMKFVVTGAVIGIIPAIPFAFYQIQTGCFDCEMFFSVSERVSDVVSPILFQRPFQILSQGDFLKILGPDVLYFAKNFPAAYLFKTIYYTEYLLLPAGLFIFYKLFKKTGFLVFPVFVLPFIYAFLKLEPQIHYFIIGAPFLYIFLASSFYYFFTNKNKALRNFARGLFVVIILFSLYYNFAFYKTISDLKNVKGDYGSVYSETEKNVRKQYQRYETDPHYQEMIIASYVPFSLTHGNIGIARLLYDPNKTQRNMGPLEERLKIVPVDRRVQNELIAYYTREVPSEETLESLKKKSEEIEGFGPIYREVLNFYNEQ